MANTRISELVVATSLDSNTQNTLLVIVDKSSGTAVTKQVELQKIDNVLDFTVDKANSAAIYANGAFVQANAAFDQANNAVDSWVRTHANSSFDLANLVFDEANSAFIQANTPSDVANSASEYANGAFEEANAAFVQANTPSHVANSASGYANAAFIHANSSYDIANIASLRANLNFLAAETRLNVSNSSTTTYQFDQYIGTNPTIYVSPGRTVAFDLTYSNGYSFLVKDSIGGSNLTSNLVHISPTGIISMNDEAQGKDSGVLFWKVPFNYVNQNYAYESSTDVSMAGVIVVEQSAKAVQQKSNTGYEHANVGYFHANSSYNHANLSFTHANSSYESQNTTGTYANAAYESQNTTGTYANAAYAQANSANILAQFSYNTANSSNTYVAANTLIWDTTVPLTMQEAIDRLANAVYILNSSNPIL